MPPGRAVWEVAWPVVAIGLVRAAYLVVDAWWVGRLGAASLTGLSAASFAWWIAVQVLETASLGTHARVARADGAGETDLGAVVTQGAWVGLALAVGVAGSAPVWIPAYLDAVGVGPELPARAEAAAWLGAVALGSFAAVAHRVVDAAFRGVGRTRLALVTAGVGLVLNAVLDPLLIWGAGPVPALGVAGAAWATAASEAVAALLGLWMLGSLGLTPRPAWPELAAASAIARIGLPVTVSGVGFSLVYVVLGRMITGFGPEQMAALGVGHRLESFCYLTAVGFMVGASTLVGQHVGAGDPGRAEDAARAAARACTVAMVAGAVPALLFAEPVYRLFTDDPAIVAAGVVYLRLQALVWVGMGFEVVYEGAFAGAARTVPSMVIVGVGTAARVPLAWGLAHGLGLGVTGIWIAIASTTLVKGVALAAWFHRGGWRDDST